MTQHGAERTASCCRVVDARAARARPARTCSTRASSSRPTASARCRGTTATTRTSSSVDGAGRSASTTSRASRRTRLFGGNSNWRGPDLVPGQLPAHRGAAAVTTTTSATTFKVECPTGSGNDDEPATRSRAELARRLVAHLPARRRRARRPVFGGDDAVPDRPALARPGPVPRVLPRRHRRAASAPATRPAGRRSSRSCWTN